MRSNTFTRMHVVKKEDKEGKLKDFIGRDIQAHKVAAKTGANIRYRLIALSMDSPVSKALTALAAEAVEAGIEIDAIFTKPNDLRPATDGALHLAMAAATCRLADDPRLLDAHEQLVLGTATAWIGDCMRRDPSKRDAYECYAEDCQETAEWATRSFDRIWASAAPLTLIEPVQADRQPSANELADPAMVAQSEQQPATAATRH